MDNQETEILENLDYRPTFGLTLRMLKPPESHKSDLVIEYTFAPGVKGPLEHTHANIVETFEVLKGALHLKVSGKWTLLTPGRTIAVNPGEPHTFRNDHKQETVVYTYIEPHRGFATFFTDLYYLVHWGQYKTHFAPRFVAYFAQLEQLHKKDYRSVQPFRTMFQVVAAIAPWIGLRIPKFPPTPIVRLYPMNSQEQTRARAVPEAIELSRDGDNVRTQ